jgi:hypothetical protein
MWKLYGAYGRTYVTAERVTQDWNAGKDFRIFDGPHHVDSYCSIRDKDTMVAEGPILLGYDSARGIQWHKVA